VPQHRAGGYGRRLARHARADGRNIVLVLSVLVATAAVVGGLLVHHAADDTRSSAPPLPKVSIPPPSTAAPTEPPQRFERQRAKARPPVLLGPTDLATALVGYCKDKVGPGGAATTTADGWRCSRTIASPHPIDMDAACRFFYGEDAWAGMLDDNDPQTWRCYRDPS
jgi:hypothetical protein